MVKLLKSKIWSIDSNGAETWIFQKIDQNYLQKF